MYTIIPKSLLLNSCLYRYKYCPCAKAVQGKVMKQEKTLSLPANQPIALTKWFTCFPKDRLK
ncbi:hypothetical protein ACLK1T_00990 [Escherichia coli]